MHPDQKIKFLAWYMEKDPPMGMAAVFECLNVLTNDNNNVNVNDNDIVTDKWFVNKPFIKGYNIVKNPDYENSNLEKDGYIKCLDCVEWFINEMLEIEGYIKNFFEKGG